MNPAVRAVVRTAINRGADIFAVYEGWQGLVDGGDRIRPVTWDDVSGILDRGGTVFGTARSVAFRERGGRRRAAHHLVQRDIDRLVVIGGDGSLSGADLLRQEWPSLLEELLAGGEIDRETAERHPALMIAGLVGSIDNDMLGTDMTIGADSALHRILEAMDAIGSTAQSHQRSFVVEVMGRHCGYLALMSAIAGNAAYVLIPEWPPDPGWERELCEIIRSGREAGRRHSVVVVAEGARDSANQPITSEYVRQLLEKELGGDIRVTTLGHVQRGGVPSAFDRWMSSILGHAAVEEVLAARDYDTALVMRGDRYTEMVHVFHSISRALPSTIKAKDRPTRIALLNVGGLAPGMNAVAGAAVRLGLDRGHTMLGVRGSFRGLMDADVRELQWGDVEGWSSLGGAELGISRQVPTVSDLYAINRGLEEQRVDGLLIIGGWDAFEAACTMQRERARYPAFQVPTIYLPATIDNNIPTSELSVGADSALNLIVDSIDR